MKQNNLSKFYRKLPLIPKLYRWMKLRYLYYIFPGSQDYWESRYADNGTSGHGSCGKLALFKSDLINSFVKKHKIRTVVEFGCGDGNQLSIASYLSYIGLDVSKAAIKICKERFNEDKTKSFYLYDSECLIDNHSLIKAELVLSLDVIYHLIEDRIFELYMTHLFASAEKFVIIYSSDTEDNSPILPHIRHRRFSTWVKEQLPEWRLLKKVSNVYPFEDDDQSGSFSDFYFYEKILT